MLRSRQVPDVLAAALLCIAILSRAVVCGQPVISAPWSKEVSTTNAHVEYPRPQMERQNWLNLNGLWDFGTTFRAQTNSPDFSDQISVPFPEKSALQSGNHRLITERQCLWYRRTFPVPAVWKGQRLLLHFEAVDWQVTVWVNSKEFGNHKGGYDRFSFDITDVVKPSSRCSLTARRRSSKRATSHHFSAVRP